MINNRLPGNNSEIIAEYRLLNAIIKNKDFLNDSRVNIDSFTSETAKSLYEAILSLYDKGIDITPASLLQAGYEIDYTVNSQIIQEVFNIEKENISRIDDIVDSLQKVQFKSNLLNKVDDIRKIISEKPNLDFSEILSSLYNIDEYILNKTQNNNELFTLHDWLDYYIKDLQERQTGRKYSFGDPQLDNYLFKGAAPGNITILAAATNSGKSTYVLSLIDNLIINNVPCMYLSNEMGPIDTMDRLMAKRLSIENSEFYNPENMSGIIEQVKEEQENTKYVKNFYFCNTTGVGIDKLKSLIREFKQRTHQNYCFIAIDLLSGMRGFMYGPSGASTASSIEMNMNRLEELAKEENVHILGVVQLNRQSDNVKISHIEQIESLRPSLGDLKNSSAYAEKATTVLVCWRKKYYADRYCKNDPATQNLEDIMEVQVLKDRSNASGKTFKYIFDGKFFRLLPLVEEDEASLDKLKNLDIDY